MDPRAADRPGAAAQAADSTSAGGAARGNGLRPHTIPSARDGGLLDDRARHGRHGHRVPVSRRARRAHPHRVADDTPVDAAVPGVSGRSSAAAWNRIDVDWLPPDWTDAPCTVVAV